MLNKPLETTTSEQDHQLIKSLHKVLLRQSPKNKGVQFGMVLVVAGIVTLLLSPFFPEIFLRLIIGFSIGAFVFIQMRHEAIRKNEQRLTQLLSILEYGPVTATRITTNPAKPNQTYKITSRQSPTDFVHIPAKRWPAIADILSEHDLYFDCDATD